jgi:predicted GNAT family acetyltransferase
MAVEVKNNEDASRYELLVDGERVGVAEYQVSGDRVVMPHTVVDPRHRGRGLAAVLVREALEDLRESGRTVVPVCWYVAQYIEEHPEYRDLMAA